MARLALGTNTQLWYHVLLPQNNLYQEHKREITRKKQITVPTRHACPTIDIGDKSFAILTSLIVLSILDGSGHVYMGSVLKMVHMYLGIYYVQTSCFLSSY